MLTNVAVIALLLTLNRYFSTAKTRKSISSTYAGKLFPRNACISEITKAKLKELLKKAKLLQLQHFFWINLDLVNFAFFPWFCIKNLRKSKKKSKKLRNLLRWRLLNIYKLLPGIKFKRDSFKFESSNLSWGFRNYWQILFLIFREFKWINFYSHWNHHKTIVFLIGTRGIEVT